MIQHDLKRLSIQVHQNQVLQKEHDMIGGHTINVEEKPKEKQKPTQVILGIVIEFSRGLISF